MNKIWIGVTGSRHHRDKHFIEDALDQYLDFVEGIVTGDARGADAIARQYALEKGLQLIVCEADWDRYGKAAGPIRNESIVIQADTILAFPLPSSKGTWNTVKQARQRGIPVDIYERDHDEQ